MSKIAPSILAANTMHLGSAVQKIVDCGCDAVHFDVMDGVFVPNISFGPNLLRDMRKMFDVYADVHLMIENPAAYIDVFAKSGADAITVHVECDTYVHAIKAIQANGLRTGASLRPGTAASELFNKGVMPDQILVMTVEPGFGGQAFMPDMLDKIKEIRRLGFQGIIEADGGVNMENAKLLTDAGVDILVMGTSFFQSDNPEELVEHIHEL